MTDPYTRRRYPRRRVTTSPETSRAIGTVVLLCVGAAVCLCGWLGGVLTSVFLLPR